MSFDRNEGLDIFQPHTYFVRWMHEVNRDLAAAYPYGVYHASP